MGEGENRGYLGLIDQVGAFRASYALFVEDVHRCSSGVRLDLNSTIQYPGKTSNGGFMGWTLTACPKHCEQQPETALRYLSTVSRDRR